MASWLSIFSLFFFFSLNAAQASLMRCQPMDRANPVIEVERHVSPGAPRETSVFLTKVQSDQHHLNQHFLVKRTRTRTELRFEDLSGMRLLRLVVSIPEDPMEDWMGRAVLDEGRSTEIRFSDLHCEMTGMTVPAIPDCPTEKINQALIEAVRWHSPEKVRLLLECGADANFVDSKGCTPLLHATDLSCGYSEVGQSRGSSHPADPQGPEAPVLGSRSALVLPELISNLYEYGATIDAVDATDGQTPLMKLARLGNVAGTRQLLGFRAKIDLQDHKGYTTLMYAAERGDEVLVRMLILEASPNFSLRNSAGQRAYDIAQAKGYDELLELLAPSEKVETIAGKEDGTCTPVMIHLSVGQAVRIKLSASKSSMFLLEAPELGLELMAMPGSIAEKVITPSRTGTFPFTCGVHGANQQTSGSFMVM